MNCSVSAFNTAKRVYSGGIYVMLLRPRVCHYGIVTACVDNAAAVNMVNSISTGVHARVTGVTQEHFRRNVVASHSV